MSRQKWPSRFTPRGNEPTHGTYQPDPTGPGQIVRPPHGGREPESHHIFRRRRGPSAS